MAADSHTLILDNGASSLKIGLFSSEEPLVVPNCITRTKTERRKSFIGNQIDEIKDLSGLYYLLPFQKGYLVNWDTQRQIWDYVYRDLLSSTTPTNTDLIITEPLFNFPSITEAMSEVLFEDYNFSSLLITTPSSLSVLSQSESFPQKPCTLIVDCGYSFTHVVPYYRGKALLDNALRIDVGGKILTNRLKDIISYRQLNVMDETYVINQIKEEVCFVSQDLYSDMDIARSSKGLPRNTIIKEYVLPDFTTRRRGYIKGEQEVGEKAEKGNDEQILRLNNERFTIPEILFHPSDIGIFQMGIPEAIVHVIEQTPPILRPYLYSNILLTGGSTKFPGFKDRISMEVRKLAPDSYPVEIFQDSCNPDYTPWYGGRALSRKRDEGEKWAEHLEPVTQSEYKENGHGICRKRFRENQIIISSNLSQK